MSWNKKSIFQNTRYSAFFRDRQSPDALRWKVALTYAIAFFLTTLICFVLIYITQHHVHYRTMEKRLADSADVLEVEYMRGSLLTSDEKCEPWHNVADAFQQKLSERYPDFTPRLVIERKNAGTQILGTLNGKPAMIPILKKSKKPGKAIVLPDTGNKQLLRTEFEEEISEERSYPFIFLHISADNTLLSSTPLPPKWIRRLLKEEEENPTGNRKHVYASIERKKYEVLLHKRRLHDGTLLIAGHDTTDAERSLRHLLVLFSITIVVVPFIGGSVGWYVGNKISRGIRRITKSARKIRNSGNYTSRLQHGSEGLEINELIDAFNAMVERTETILAELKTMSENVIHDLRTPITRLRTRAELAIQEDPHCRELASDIAEECSNMLDIINTTLEISQAESGSSAKMMEQVDLCSIVENIADLYSVAAEDAEISVEIDRPDQPLIVPGDKTRLQRLVANLLDNAIKYTGNGGKVTLAVSRTDDSIRLQVKDTGCGISHEDQKHIFDRFYRADASRTKPGNGLGLCLVKAITEYHNGTISVISEVGRGTSIAIFLPENLAEK